MPTFQTDNKNKAFVITLGGFAETEKAATFVDDLKLEVSKINVLDYTLLIDSTELKTFKPAILPYLETSYGLYSSFGFKRIVLISPKRVTPRLQIKRIAKKVNFTCDFVVNMQEALKELSK